MKNRAFIWYVVTLFGSALPMILRVFFCIGDNSKVVMWDNKDLAFFTIAISLPNYALIGQEQVLHYFRVAVYSLLLIAFTSFELSKLFSQEFNYGENNFSITIVLILFAVLAIWLSYITNFNYSVNRQT